jgi:hypothetical protein
MQRVFGIRWRLGVAVVGDAHVDGSGDDVVGGIEVGPAELGAAQADSGAGGVGADESECLVRQLEPRRMGKLEISQFPGLVTGGGV